MSGSFARCLAAWMVLASMLVPATSWCSEEAARWRLITPFPSNSLPVANAKRFAADLQAWTAGAIRIAVRHGADSPAHHRILAALAAGEAEIGEVLLSAHTNRDLVFGIDTLPFLAVNYPKARKLWAQSHLVIDKALESQGLRIIQVSPLPAPAFFSARPLTEIADFRGLRVWAPDEEMARFAQELGAEPVRLPAASLRVGLDRGTIEAFAMSPEAGYSMRIWRWVPYFLDVPIWIPKSALVVREASLAAAPTTAVQALVEVLQQSEERAWRTAKQANRDAVQALRDGGMEVLRASPTFRGQLLDVGQVLTARWTERAGDAGIAIIDRFLSLQL